MSKLGAAKSLLLREYKNSNDPDVKTSYYISVKLLEAAEKIDSINAQIWIDEAIGQGREHVKAMEGRHGHNLSDYDRAGKETMNLLEALPEDK
jgi:hypothetical protein